MFALTEMVCNQVYNLAVTDNQYWHHTVDNPGRRYMTHVLRAKSAEQESQKLRATSTSSTLYITSQNSNLCRQMSHTY